MLAHKKRGTLGLLTFLGSTIALAGCFIAACTTSTETDPGAPDGGSSDPNPTGAQVGSSCASGGDCRTGVCTDGICQAASPSDGVKNGDESDVDCGGPAAPACALGKQCKVGTDCTTGKCENGTCVADPSKPPGPNDGIKNNGETDVDCGGPDAATPRCEVDKTCGGNGDCKTPLVCENGKCTSKPLPNDGIKNGTETDVDCGGPDAATPRCAVGKACLVHADCTTGCSWEKKCASRPSCTQLEGGYTCGPNDVATKQNDCCETANVGQYKVDKYLVTGGRIRAFLDRLNGDLKTYAGTLPANKWSQADTAKMPANMTEAFYQLGPFYGKRSCDTGRGAEKFFNGHTFWTPKSGEPMSPGDDKDFPKEVLDTKAVNCIPWHIIKAFCIWDGGHLATLAELKAAYYNNNLAGVPFGAGATVRYPWGAAGTYLVTSGGQPVGGNGYAVQNYDYSTPGNWPNARMTGTDFADIAYYVAPPGRRPMGYNATGHADLLGNLLEWVGDQYSQFVWNGSFERHAAEADAKTAAAQNPWLDVSPNDNGNTPWLWTTVASGANLRGDDVDPNNAAIRSMGYYGLGGRCARD